MIKITIGEAAKILSVNKKTLMRWDETDMFPAEREPVSKIRIYDKAIVEKTARWFDLRKRHKEHVHKITAIQANIDRFISTRPLSPGENLKGMSTEEAREMKKAFDVRREWFKEEDEFDKEYVEFTEGFYGKLEK